MKEQTYDTRLPEALALTGVSYGTIYKAVVNGELSQRYDEARRLTFCRAELLRWKETRPNKRRSRFATAA